MVQTGSIEARAQYWQQYDDAAIKFNRCSFGAMSYLYHRLTRWWGLKPGLAALQIAYIASMLLGLAIAIASAWSPSDKVKVEPGFVGFVLSWSTVILPICGVISVVYKNYSSTGFRSEEMPRREAVTSLLLRINQRNAVTRSLLGGQVEARLNEICECVRRDAQEQLQLTEDDVGVQFLAWHPGDQGGLISQVASDRAALSKSFQHGARYGLSLCVYEAVRLKRALAFHDVMDVRLLEAFGEVKSSYRSFFCTPVTLLNSSQPYGILVVKLKRAYALWPKNGNVMDRRLSLYVQLLTIYWAGKEHAKTA